MTIGVLIADDQALVRTGFRMILEPEQELEVWGKPRTGPTRSRRRGAAGPT